MSRLRRISIAAALAALAVGAGSGARAETVNVPWSELLPPLPTSNDVQPRAVRQCRRAKPRCVLVTIRRLRRLRNRLGCDHRAVFATTYLELTKQIWDDMRAGRVRRGMIDPKYLYLEDAIFANFYFRTFRAWSRGRPVPKAWQIAFEASKATDKGGVQDMLLGINAHVQNDMPFVLASMGLRMQDGRSRKPDHDFTNATLNRGYPRVVKAVRDRYDSAMDVTNPPFLPTDDLLGLELTRTWREGVWRNAERLVNADTRAERTRVARSIEDAAAVSARLIAAGGVPGYAATRDAYCAEGPSG